MENQMLNKTSGERVSTSKIKHWTTYKNDDKAYFPSKSPLKDSEYMLLQMEDINEAIEELTEDSNATI